MLYPTELDKAIVAYFTSSKLYRKHYSESQSLTFDTFIQSAWLKYIMVQEGVSKTIFDLLLQYMQWDKEQWSSLLNDAKDFSNTQINYLDTITSQRIIEITETYYKGLDVFGDNERFIAWMQLPNKALGEFRPIELLSHAYGKELLLNELSRIEHGVLA